MGLKSGKLLGYGNAGVAYFPRRPVGIFPICLHRVHSLLRQVLLLWSHVKQEKLRPGLPRSRQDSSAYCFTVHYVPCHDLYGVLDCLRRVPRQSADGHVPEHSTLTGILLLLW